MTAVLVFVVLALASCCCTASRIVNVSDAWLLSDAESPVFYRHFRDRVTWSEAEAICQFHHSVLATVRNTGEFDRTRALLQDLNWRAPVWVGLRRVLGQPMFRWSSPVGATLLPSDGYWHDAPDTRSSSHALCVTIDPSADFRWRAVECASPTELRSFLCQIPVPSWARSRCLSPHWPSTEVTVQYLPRTRALEMTADCGLQGTKRIACKQFSTVDIGMMEHRLQCPVSTSEMSTGSVTPPRPPTRHRRDTKPSTNITPRVVSTTDQSTQAAVTSQVPSTSTSAATPSTTLAAPSSTPSAPLQQATEVFSTKLPDTSTEWTTRTASTASATTFSTTTRPSTTLAVTTRSRPHLSPGTPRNVAAVTHVGKHMPPLLVVSHAAGLPRNIPSPVHVPLSTLGITVKVEGTPRIAEVPLHRSAEDHVTSRRRQFLPAPLRGMPVSHAVTPQPQEGEPMNSQTEEEMQEAANRRQHSRRSNRMQQQQQGWHQARNMYPFLVNRMLG